MLKNILHRYADVMEFDHFDVRGKCEVPDLSYDIYIFSGGPGDPLESGGKWQEPFFGLIGKLWQWNLRNEQKKHVLFICHS
ncbi:MAG: GMP synthase, partial [Saprospiraceae bacterium]|nr:GMP synthase [Saprospiraceae bacterium]